MANERIQGTDSIISAVMKLTDGNPGAAKVCIQAAQGSPCIDPIGALGGFAPLLSLDTLHIYGPRIWMLYKDVCGEQLPYFLAMLRGWQLGFLPESVLNHAIDNDGAGLDVEKVAVAVCERIPEFNLVAGVPA